MRNPTLPLKNPVLVKSEMIYAYEQYPEMADNEINRLMEAAGVINYTSFDYGSTWEISGANYVHWAKWDKETGNRSNGSKSKWAPFQSYVLKSELTPEEMEQELENFENGMPNTVSDSWILTNTINRRNPNTMDVALEVNSLNVFSSQTYSDQTEGTHPVVPIMKESSVSDYQTAFLK